MLLLLLSLVLINSGCSAKGGITDLAEALAEKIVADPDLTITPATSSVVAGGNLNFTAGGGKPPYTYSVSTGTGSTNSSTGLYTAPAIASVEKVRVTDSAGKTAEAAILVYLPLTAGSTALTQVGAVASSAALNTLISGGVLPLTYSLSSGPGAINSSTGYYTLPYTATNSVVKVSDAVGNSTLLTVANSPVLVDGSVSAIAVSGNTAYLAGSFKRANPISTVGMVQLSAATGAIAAEDCNPKKHLNANASVQAVATQGDDLYLAGYFSSYGGETVPNLIKVSLSTCQLDKTFTQATGFNSVPSALYILGDSLFVGGYFSSYRGAAAKGLAKINLSNGDLNTTFDQSVGLGAGGGTAFAVNAGALYVGGSFSSYQGTTVQSLIKIDPMSGVLDTTFSQTTGINGYVNTMVVAGGALYVGGHFSQYRGVSAQNLAKVNLADGTLDTTFTQASGVGFPDHVEGLESDGTSLFVAGEFWTYRGVSAQNLIKVDLSTGNLDAVFNAGPTLLGNAVGATCILLSGSYLYIGGYDNISYAGTPVSNILRVSAATGALDTAFSGTASISSSTEVIAALSNGNIFVGGEFQFSGGVRAEGLAKFNLTDGSVDSAFSAAGGFDGPVSSLKLVAGSLYAGGGFTNYRGSPAQRIAKVDPGTGALDTTFTQATGFSAAVYSIASTGTSLYVSGSFTTYRGAAANYLAKIDLTNGVLDTTFTQATGPNQVVYAVATDGVALYFTGLFISYRGAAARYLAKVDLTNGNLDGVFTQATGLSTFGTAIETDGSSVYVGGYFTGYRGTGVQRLIKVDSTSGNLDATFTQATGMDAVVKSFFYQAGGSLYVGGQFNTYRGAIASGIAKLDTTTGNLDSSFSHVIGNGTITAIAPWGTAMLLGGTTTTYHNNPHYYFFPIDAATGELR